jgi:hypothetical protein
MSDGGKSPFENLIAGPSVWPAAYHQLQELIGVRGAIPFLLLAAALFVWWKWEGIAKRPGVERFIKWLKREAVPTAPTGRLTIGVARLSNAKDREHEKLLLDELRHFDGVETVPIPRTVDPDQPDKKKAKEEARSLLRETGADVLIWGNVITLRAKARCGSTGLRRGTFGAPPESICRKPRPSRCP